MGGKLPDDLLPSKVSKDLPAWMDEIVKHTIVANLDERWQDADEFITFINNSIEEERRQSRPFILQLVENRREENLVSERYEARSEGNSFTDTS